MVVLVSVIAPDARAVPAPAHSAVHSHIARHLLSAGRRSARPRPGAGRMRGAERAPDRGQVLTAHCPRSTTVGPAALGRTSTSKIAVGT